MPRTPAPELSQPKLKQLLKLLIEYGKYIRNEQPSASEVISLIAGWINNEIEK